LQEFFRRNTLVFRVAIARPEQRGLKVDEGVDISAIQTVAIAFTKQGGLKIKNITPK